jgi:hypothetical protein
MLRSSLWLTTLALAASSLTLAGCSQAKVDSSSATDGTSSGGKTTVASGGATGSGTGGGIDITYNPDTPKPQATDAGTTAQVVACDGGDGCTCPPFNVAVIGKPGKWGTNPAGDPDTALQEWLNTSSVGTAKADNFTNRVKLTPDFLATYNVIILASLSEDSNNGPWWTFDNSETAAFQDWIEKGGGVISLSGYSGGSEVAPLNQLLGFSGVTYNQDGVWGDRSDSQFRTCAGTNALSTWNKSDPVIANLSNNVTLIGLENGHSINAPADAHVVAAVWGLNALVGKLVGKGHVLAYADEWITYTSQWNGAGNPKSSDPTCAGYLPQQAYQTAQFWYNMIKWSQPSATCFKIVNEQQPVSLW